MQGHAVVVSPGIGDRLLVNHFGTGRAANLRQRASDATVLGQGQCFRGLEHRHDLAHGDRQGRVIRPLRLVGQSNRHAATGIFDERHHRAHRALIGESQARLKKAGQRVVIKLHPEADRRRDLDLRSRAITAACADKSDSGDRPVGHNRLGGRRVSPLSCRRSNGHCRRASITAAASPLIKRDCRDGAATHTGLGAGTGLGVGTAVGPVVALAILESEGIVACRCTGPAGQIRRTDDFVVQYLASVIQRQGQRKQRSRRLGLGPCDGIVS